MIYVAVAADVTGVVISNNIELNIADVTGVIVEIACVRR